MLLQGRLPHLLYRSFSATPELKVTWSDFFALRKSKKNYERVASFTIGTLGLFASGRYFFFEAEFDPTTPLFGLPDPTIVYIGATMAIGAASAAVGLLAGSNVFRLVHSSRKALLDAKEKDFFNRLVKHRPKDIKFLAVPGSGETLTLPDYYGEKINSVADYRKWIRKQKRFIARNVVGR